MSDSGPSDEQRARAAALEIFVHANIGSTVERQQSCVDYWAAIILKHMRVAQPDPNKELVEEEL